MSTWIITAAIPMVFSTIVVGSACCLASQRDRALEEPEPILPPRSPVHLPIGTPMPTVGQGQ